MNQLRLTWLLIIFLLSASALASTANEPLAPEEQQRIIENYMFATGQRSRAHQPASAAVSSLEDLPIRCGTSIIREYRDNHTRLDRNLVQSLGAQQLVRPSMPLVYDSPQGFMRIHYTTQGDSAVYQAGIDSDGNGVPDYVEQVAIIADSVYDVTINSLRYPQPISDATCPNGGDRTIDVYLLDLPTGFFGFTVADTNSSCDFLADTLSLPSWIEMDNDFQQISLYKDQPLDAARVTLAHEFFHVVHFSMDWTESRVLFEMTATWMEEVQYDDINDYYVIIPQFYKFPGRSIQSELNLHHYGSAVFPIYLMEKFPNGEDIVLHVWIRSRELGVNLDGGDYLQAFDEAIDSACVANASLCAANDLPGNLSAAMTEFALWNYFTGGFADQAPNGIGYSEAASYPVFPADSMDRVGSYPIFVIAPDNPFNPDINASAFIRFENSDLMKDSIFDPFFTLGEPPIDWGVTRVLELAAIEDSNLVMSASVSGITYLDSIINPSQYRSITFIFTASIPDGSHFPPNALDPEPRIGYAANGNLTAVQVLPDMSLLPYPNPAVISQMAGEDAKFRLEVPEELLKGNLLNKTVKIVLDLFNVAGEHLRTIEIIKIVQDRDIPAGGELKETISWDMRNEGGEQVASGVYLAHARLYGGASLTRLIAQDKKKIAIIR